MLIFHCCYSYCKRRDNRSSLKKKIMLYNRFASFEFYLSFEKKYMTTQELKKKKYFSQFNLRTHFCFT